MALSDTILDAAEEIKKDLDYAGENMYLPWQRKRIRSLAEELVAIGHQIGAHPDRWHESDPNVVSLDQAKQIMAEHTNGTVSDISAGKGGRVWLDGEFNLAEIEAIAVMIRSEVGRSAQGAKELIGHWRKEGMLDEQQPNSIS